MTNDGMTKAACGVRHSRFVIPQFRRWRGQEAGHNRVLCLLRLFAATLIQSQYLPRTSDCPSPQPDSPLRPQRLTVAPEQAGRRLDVFLAGHFPAFSRAALQRAIEAGHVRVDGAPAKPSLKLHAGSEVVVDQIEVPRDGPAPQDIPLDVLYEDDVLAVVNKPPGMIVHPAKGHWEGTLASALAHHFGRLSERGGPTRPGIVHRLDRDTSGVIVVAKNDQTHEALASQFKARRVEKEYLAIVVGVPDRDRDLVEQPIASHPSRREMKAIRHNHPTSRPAATFYEVVERFVGYSFLRALPKTGRTHQIRLHLAHIGCPVLCDRLYGGRASISEEELMTPSRLAPGASRLLDRQALHAHRLTFTHPTSGEVVSFTAPLPADMELTLDALRRWRQP
jgi:23S rRNA pseudouridine1911/1915/1917 synthase